MQIGGFNPTDDNFWLSSTTSPPYRPSFALNRTIVEKAERYGLEVGQGQAR